MCLVGPGRGDAWLMDTFLYVSFVGLSGWCSGSQLYSLPPAMLVARQGPVSFMRQISSEGQQFRKFGRVTQSFRRPPLWAHTMFRVGFTFSVKMDSSLRTEDRSLDSSQLSPSLGSQ